uniref:PiggyBac transposable element-derived protein domain-containing protein n=1 Tax=Clastoptera arizonana TaxID=38151 RepID=A0A1B6C430_9HEMI
MADRILDILRCLYLSHVTQSNTNNTQPSTSMQAPHSSTEKIDEIVFYFINKMAQIIILTENCLLTSQWSYVEVFHQYIKGKRHKFGVKLYSLNEPDGLMYKLKIYAGTGDETTGFFFLLKDT